MITFLILYGELCNYFIWHDALRAIVVGGKFESRIQVSSNVLPRAQHNFQFYGFTPLKSTSR